MTAGGSYELPAGVLDVRLSVFGQSGQGKTNVAKRAAERLLSSGKRIGVIDPTDSWYGLRKKPDGKRDAFKVIIFGGEYGDLPLNIHAGATIGAALARAKESWIVSLAEMPGDAERAAFTADFLSALYDSNRAPLYLIVDEADAVAPEKPDTSAAARSVSRMREIVKRGRKRGFIPWLITQRPADIAKSVTSQTEALVCLSLTLPHDIQAVNKWVGEHDKDGSAKRIFATMPEQAKGEGIVWWPKGKLLTRERFAKSKTFDSGKAPEAGDVRVKLKPLKVDSLAKAVADLIRDREENAPERLRERIAELERSNAALQRSGNAGDAAELQRLRDRLTIVAHLSFARGKAEGFGQVLGSFEAVMLGANERLKLMTGTYQSLKDVVDKLTKAADPPGRRLPEPAPAPPVRTIHVAGDAPRPVKERIAGALASVPLNGEARLRPGERTILTVLAQAGDAVKSPRVAARAKMARNGGTFKTYAGRLRQLGFVASGDPMAITPAGLQALGAFDPLPTGRALLDHWKTAGDLRPGEQKILDAVAAGYSSADAIGTECDMPPTGGTFKTYMGRLKSLGLISGDGRTGFSLHEDLR